VSIPSCNTTEFGCQVLRVAITINKILKIDIEGAEKEVFSNASEWICKVKSIIVKLHNRMRVDCSRSFYCNTDGFDNEWQGGKDIYLARGNYIKKITELYPHVYPMIIYHIMAINLILYSPLTLHNSHSLP